MLSLESFAPTHEIVKLIASIEAFRGSWRALKNMAPEHLARLRHVATIESIGSSTRIEGSHLSDREVDALHGTDAAVGDLQLLDREEAHSGGGAWAVPR